MDGKAKAAAFLEKAGASGIGPAEVEALIKEVAEEVAPAFDFEAAFSELKSELSEIKAALKLKPQKGKSDK